MLTSCLRAFLVSASLLGGIASAQTVVFNDTFGAGSTINSNPTNPAAPLIDRTAYQQVTAKTFNPNPPTLAAGHLRYGIVSTSSGFSSIEALFTQYPVTLSNVGEYIELTVVFTNQAGILTANANGTLMCALHDGSQSQPVAGGLNATSDTYATGGNAANWAGYISRILYTGGNHQICSRAAQGAVARCQDVLYNFNNPSASTIGSLTVSSLGALSVGQQYTLVFRVTKTAASAVTIASALYQGADTNGTQVFTQSVVSSSIPVSTFDALAIGYRETGSVASTMDVNSIKVVTTASTTVVPVISTQPTSQTVTVGDPVSFSVLADGGGAALSYQWKKDGNDISGATAASYSIASAAAGDAASYTVVVTDAAGSTTSNAAVLTVSTGAVAPVITAQPTAQTALVGDSATFTASFSGTAPNAAQWQKSTNGGTTYSDISGATGTTSPTSYTIPSAALSDAALYRVVVTNSVGSATSDGAALTVNEMPAITAQPVGSTITPGSSHTLSITATGSPTPTYQWKLNGVNISGATSSSYTIPNASGANAGFYTCTASNVVGSVTSSSAYVGVLSALTVSTLTPAPAGTGLNRDVLLKITFSGNVTAGSTGRIRIYDQSAPATPVETLDMSTAVPITQFSVPYRYMLKTISGQAFAYQPILINGNTATICPRSSTVLAYNKTYYVTIEPGAILDSTGATWGGISDPSAWTFTTKAAGPAAGATTLNVAADGTGDFDTVQGAVDFIPYSPANTIPRSITIQDGTYTEIVRLRSGQNLVTMQGQSRAGTTIQYLTNNNTAGQLSALGASFSSVGQRSVFGSEPNDFTLQNLTLRNSTPYTGPQAECFWGGNNAQRMTVNEVNILSYQDTIMTNGGV
ncbi:MAG: immunoglobulin domain-containing protein, partial [Verrucomicrobiales bacterium]|nr:immunoglobulin domain-containing protein [Verrucomicrobiales bacterium]